MSAQRTLETLGVVGLLARAVVFGLIGWFLGKAAVEYDPDEAIGLDGALAKLTEAPYGPLLLGLTAAGLIAYGLFCIAQARYRDAMRALAEMAVAQFGGVAALDEGDPFVAEFNARCRTNADLVMRTLGRHARVAILRPEGAFYAFPRVEGITDRAVKD